MMSNLTIAYDDRSQSGTFSGGAWDSGLALANLKNYDPKKVARSDDAEEASTTFVLDIGSATDIDFVGIVGHNLTDMATARVRIGPNADGSSALIDQTLTVSNFGTYTPAAGKALFYLSTATISARYVLWEISDEYNPDGYVQIGRHIVGPVFQPAVNVSYGAQITMIDESRITRTVNGTLYADMKPKRRRMAGAFDTLTDAEGFGEVYDMQDTVGLSIPVFAILDPSLTGNQLQRSAVYGTLMDMTPITMRAAWAEDIATWQFALDERN